jgi:hypothetical protein
MLTSATVGQSVMTDDGFATVLQVPEGGPHVQVYLASGPRRYLWTTLARISSTEGMSPSLMSYADAHQTA